MDIYPQFSIDQDWGTPYFIEECCPGVYFLLTKSDSRTIGKELYAISKDYNGDIISKETMRYGVESNGMLLFDLDKDDSGARLVDYEIKRYRVKMGLALDPMDSIYSTALFASEHYPSYFGGQIPPRYTPYGLTVRVKTVENGIYFLETDQCKWLLALSYTIWDSGLTAELEALGSFYAHDLASGENATRYLFFTQDCFPPVIYELCEIGPYQGFADFISSKQALMNAVWEQSPLYAIQWNLREQLGLGVGNCLHRLLASLGCDDLPDSDQRKEEDVPRSYITYQSDLAARGFLRLPI